MSEFPNTSGVYCILNTANQKRYVGSSTRSLRGRLRSHRQALVAGTHYNLHFQSSWNKYKAKSFKFIILVECHEDECIRLEQHYIDLFNSSDPVYGYNRSPTAGNTLGFKFSKASCQKISVAKKGTKMTEEAKRNMSIAGQGKSKSDTHRAKISAALRGKIKPEEHRRKLSEANKGKCPSTETRAKLSKAATGRIKSEETRKKLSTANKGKIPSLQCLKAARAFHRYNIVSPETKQKMSVAQTRRHAANRCK